MYYLNRFPHEQGLLATPLYHALGDMWKLVLHTLYYAYCTELPTIFFFKQENYSHTC